MHLLLRGHGAAETDEAESRERPAAGPRRAEIEQLLRMQQKVQLRLNPDAPLKQPAPLLVSVRPAERLAPAAKAAPTLEQGPDGTARLQYEGAGEATLPASAFQGHTMAVLVDHQHGLGPVCAAALTAGTLLESDFDTRVRDFLLNVPEATAALAIEEFAAVDKSTVNNRCVLARRAKPAPRRETTPLNPLYAASP